MVNHIRSVALFDAGIDPPAWSRSLFTVTEKAWSRKQLPAVLDRFCRADKSRSRETGDAGLAIVKAIIEATVDKRRLLTQEKAKAASSR